MNGETILGVKIAGLSPEIVETLRELEAVVRRAERKRRAYLKVWCREWENCFQRWSARRIGL